VGKRETLRVSVRAVPCLTTLIGSCRDMESHAKIKPKMFNFVFIRMSMVTSLLGEEGKEVGSGAWKRMC
jgi:hypothetical protein